MGVDYIQNCVFGFAVKAEDLLVELSPEITEEQPRYDTRTGQVSHYEKVIVKQSEEVYRFEDLEDEELYVLAKKIGEKYPDFEAQVYTDDNYDEVGIYVGYKLGERANDWGTCLLDGEVSMDELLNMKNSLANNFPEFQDKIKIHFFWWAG